MIAATVYGRIGQDPELSYTAGGDPVLNFSVASNSIKKDAAPTWVRVAVWGKRGETLRPMLHKGDRVCASGRVEMREWESASGSGTSLDMNASEVALVETREDSESRGGAAPQQQPTQRQPQQQQRSARRGF